MALGPDAAKFIAANGPNVLNKRFDTFLLYETTLLVYAHKQVASAISTRFVAVTDEEGNYRPLAVDV